MSESYSGKTYPISKLTPKYLFNNNDIKQQITVFMWSDLLDYKPPKYINAKSSVVLEQLQTIMYTTNTVQCPFTSEDKE